MHVAGVGDSGLHSSPQIFPKFTFVEISCGVSHRRCPWCYYSQRGFLGGVLLMDFNVLQKLNQLFNCCETSLSRSQCGGMARSMCAWQARGLGQGRTTVVQGGSSRNHCASLVPLPVLCVPPVAIEPVSREFFPCFKLAMDDAVRENIGQTSEVMQTLLMNERVDGRLMQKAGDALVQLQRVEGQLGK
ncbi:hypothetical protein GOP47_0000978 [Adiantum capillus-veneris]|uniref:Uncharacterized protein n=1 Tax=Adiantum capillus-veneris TaxID=13818 RepID=A0A9D4VEA9_ADICA|nr:hypothetical protein GOP47_0000978 [Adiantum capillus-veneris]